MVKRASRESPKDRTGSADLSDISPVAKRRRYELRKRKLSSGSEPPNDNKKKKKADKSIKLTKHKNSDWIVEKERRKDFFTEL